MNRLLTSTAVCLILGTAAFAQSPNNSTNNAPAASQSQSRDRDRDKDAATQRAPDSAAQNRPSSPAPDQSSQNQSSQNPNQSSQNQNQSSQNQPSQNQSSQHQPSGSSQNQSSQNQQNQPSGSAQNQPADSTANRAAPNSGQSPSQAQGNSPAQSGSSPPASQAQGNNPPASGNQAQQRPDNANTAQQPASANQNNTAQSRQDNVNASVNLNEQQRSRVSQSFARLNVQPERNVNFSVSVGTAVPRDVHLHTLPADIVEVVPQYRGYSFVAVRDEIVIVDPATYKIVTVLPRSGGGSAAAPAQSRRHVSLSERDRDLVRKHARTSTERRTTGSSAARVQIRRGERVPDSVEMEEFPETVYREAPALREYRYIHRDSRTYVVEPTERTIIEEID